MKQYDEIYHIYMNEMERRKMIKNYLYDIPVTEWNIFIS